MIYKDGKAQTSFPGWQFDGQIHSVEWFTPSGKWKRIIDTSYPLNDAEILDDTLDCGGFQFTNELHPYPDENDESVPEEEKIHNIKQLTPIRILWDSADDFETEDHSSEFDKDLDQQINGKKPVKRPIWRYRVVDEVTFSQRGRLFKFAVKTLEPTKLLELETCDTLTFTKRFQHIGSIPSVTKSGQVDDIGFIAPIIFEEYEIGTTIYIPPFENLLNFSHVIYYEWNKAFVGIKFPDGSSEGGPTQGIGEPGDKYILLNQLGVYEISLNINFKRDRGIDCSICLKFTISIVEKLTQKTNKELTISNCLNRIVAYGKTRRYEPQKFYIADFVLEKYNNITAPEFHLTRSTMWEALKTVAGHVHCVPRLIWNEQTMAFDTIAFDELGGSEKCHLKAIYNNKPIAWDIKKTLDSYCGQIETYVDNLINTRDYKMGTIVEPFISGWISARASDGEIEVRDNTVRFKCSYPNYRISKLEIKYGNKTADISKHVFEAAQYETLSNYQGKGVYAGSALRYIQGGKEIDKLDYIVPEGYPFGGLMTNESIINIAKQYGIEIDRTKFKEIQYRISYSPIISARIIQKKPYIKDYSGYSRFYNITANTIESEFLGEHLKGAIARIGQDIEYRTYMFERSKDLPKPGTLLDGKYIVQVIAEIQSVVFIKATLILTEDYNQKSEYIAIDSNYRLFDVSEKQSIERHINYSENLILGEKVLSSENAMITDLGIKLLKQMFVADSNENQICWAYFRGKYGDFLLNRILLPCISQSEGNSLLLNFSCMDNFGAGYQISHDINESMSVQTILPYGNDYGEIETLDLVFGNKNSINMSNELAKKLPEYIYESTPNGLFTTGQFPLLIGKDSREHVNLTYQLHFMTNQKDIIIGSAFGSNNPLVTESKKLKCYILNCKINKFTNVFSVADLEEIDYTVSPISNRSFFIKANNTSKNGAKAFAWCKLKNDEKYAELSIGVNRDLGEGQISESIYFSFN